MTGRRLRPLRKVGRALELWRAGTLKATLSGRWHRRLRLLRGSNILWFLDSERVLMRRFEERFRPPGPAELERVGNYQIVPALVPGADAIVYSVGVGGDIAFDEAMVRRFGCTVHLFDPTPASIELMSGDHDQRLVFVPLGVWTENAMLHFTAPLGGGSPSAVFDHGGERFDGDCRTIATHMGDLGHDYIDVLKMDIEGAALPVLEQLLDDGIQPTQIVVELERPRRDVAALARYLVRVADVTAKANHLGYEVIRLPRQQRRYFSIELLLVKQRA